MTMLTDYVSTLDPERGGIRVTDEDIDKSVYFEGHGPEYLKWPKNLWHDPSNGVPDQRVDHNAWHVKYLAAFMNLECRWHYHPLRLGACGRCVIDGNHRYRAIQYLRDAWKVIIEPLVLDQRSSLCHGYCKPTRPNVSRFVDVGRTMNSLPLMVPNDRISELSSDSRATIWECGRCRAMAFCEVFGAWAWVAWDVVSPDIGGSGSRENGRADSRQTADRLAKDALARMCGLPPAETG